MVPGSCFAPRAACKLVHVPTSQTTSMRENITDCADEALIEKAREPAHGDDSRLNEQIRFWLTRYDRHRRERIQE